MYQGMPCSNLGISRLPDSLTPLSLIIIAPHTCPAGMASLGIAPSPPAPCVTTSLTQSQCTGKLGGEMQVFS